MQPAREGGTERGQERGTVRTVSPGGLALIMTDTGRLAIVRQLDGPQLVIGDVVSGLGEQPGDCVLRNETTRAEVAVAIDALGVAPTIATKVIRAD